MNDTQQPPRNTSEVDQDSPVQLIQGVLHLLEHVLPSQAPIKDFVHHNTLHGFESLPFVEAVAVATRLTGARGYLPEARFREYLAQGRIDRADLVAVLQQALGEDILAPVTDSAAFDPTGSTTTGTGSTTHGDVTVRRLDVLLASFLVPLEPLTPSQMRWRAVELGTLQTPKGLWQTCLDVLGLQWEEAHREEDAPAHVTSPKSAEPIPWPALADRLGQDWTLRQLLLYLAGEDIFDYLRPNLIRHLAAHLDQGLASWHSPMRDRGFYAAWRESAGTDLAWTLAGLVYPTSALPSQQWTTALPESAAEAIHTELTRLGLPEDRWCPYLERLALELPGWSGMCLWHHRHAEGSAHPAAVNMVDYLAVRLVLERFYADALCRRRWGVTANLAALSTVSFEIPKAPFTVTPICTRAWPLFALARHLQLDAAALRQMGRTGAEQMLAILGELDEQKRGYLWLSAYERHYREQILATLVANHGRGAWAQRQTIPQAQLIFCMDDREEGMRRHLEEINPHLETLGAAAHFNVPHRWCGLDATTPVDLAPVIPHPEIVTHEIHEHARCHDQGVRHRRYHAWRRRIAEGFYQGTRNGMIVPALRSMVAALPVALGLAIKTLAPAQWDRFLQRLASWMDTSVTTTIHVTQDNAARAAAPPSTDTLYSGFTDEEQFERVRKFLRSNGLTYGFAPLVAVIGHASHSQNNPHAAAYNCGACAGRYSGPNARIMAAMANRPPVRALLANDGIVIPAHTWFLGAEHDTCDDRVTWWDTEDVPASLQPAFDSLRADVATAGRAHAQERCRRFASAPAGLSPERAMRHVRNRSADFAQPRPELGHATNACAFFGRRAMSRGGFFDRRAFLISYDPTQDPDGAILERHLLNNGAVGAGISLEYYFSTVDNERYGCGTKVTHNVTGLLGVMEGANSDLRTGLPRQMIEIHEPMRLLVVIEQKTALITAIYQRQTVLQKLIGNGWLIVAAKDPDSPTIHLFEPTRGWVLWQGSGQVVPTTTRSVDWFLTHREALPPVLLDYPDDRKTA